MKEKKVTITGIAETRCRSDGRMTVYEDYTLLYRSRQEGTTEGAAIPLSPEVAEQ